MVRAAGLLLGTAILALCCGANSQVDPRAPVSGYRLIWEDDFEGDHFDPAKWGAASATRDAALLSPDAVSVHEGLLRITTYTQAGRNVTAILSTEGKFEPCYGFFEARIRFRNSPGEWSAFWIQSPTIGEPLSNPGIAGTEIDIVEHRVQDAHGSDISNTESMSVHWDGYGPFHKLETAMARPSSVSERLQGSWHIYGLLWTPERYAFYLDGVEKWSTRTAVSHREEFLRLSSEVKARGWAGDIPEGGYGSRLTSNTVMEVDWVRVWQQLRPEGCHEQPKSRTSHQGQPLPTDKTNHSPPSS